MSDALRPGIHYDVPEHTYHADPCERPSLSSGIAKVLLDEAPVRAWMMHPRLGGPPEAGDPSRVMEIGTVAHKLILGRGREVVEIDADDYRTGAAKEARREAYAGHKCPILFPDLTKAHDIATQVLAGIADVPHCRGFIGAPSEVVVVAEDPSGAMLRIMCDALELRDDGTAVIWDVKTGDQSAAPHTLGARVSNMVMELQAEFYRHVLALARPDLREIKHRFLFVENEAPHLFTVAEIDATAREMGRRKTAYAIALWNKCMRENQWPGYPARIVVPEYPAYAETKWMAREDMFEAMGVHAL